MKVRKRIVWFAAGMALVGVGLIAWARTMEPVFKAEGKEYEGILPQFGPVRLTLGGDLQKPVLISERLPLRHSEHWGSFMTLDARANPLKYSEQWWSFVTNQSGTLVFASELFQQPARLEIVSSGSVLKGRVGITNDAGKPFELRHTIDLLGCHSSSGFTIKGRGAAFAWYAGIPSLGEGDFERAVTAWMQADCRRRETEERAAFHPTLAERWKGMVSGATAWQWSSDVRWRVFSRSTNSISLLAHHYRYTGGASGYTDIASATFRWENGTLWRVRLTEFFRADAEWASRLQQEIRAGLASEGASSATDDAIKTVIRMDRFVMDAEGLVFHFSADEAGTFGKVVYTARIPWEKLGEVLAPGRR